MPAAGTALVAARARGAASHDFIARAGVSPLDAPTHGSELQPLYIFKPGGSEDPYVAYFTASLDLNQDGTDELVVEASYRIGTAFKVISMAGGKYEQVFTSYYRGPS